MVALRLVAPGTQLREGLDRWRRGVTLLLLSGCLMAFALPTRARSATTTQFIPGFRVASGSRLSGGTAFPIHARQELHGAKRGWTATLAITGSAGAVYDAYAAQARTRLPSRVG